MTPNQRVFAVILLIFVGVEFAVMLVLHVAPPMPPLVEDVVDAVSLALLGAPFVWLLVARPLARAAARAVHEREQALQALQLFRTLVDRSNDAVEIIDPASGRFLDVNEKGCRDLGYTREELLTHTIFDVTPSMDRNMFLQSRDRLSEAGGMILTGVHRRKDGSTFPVEVSLSHVQVDRAYNVAVVRDISDRIRAEEQQRLHSSALNASAVPMVITDREGMIVWINAAFTAGTGYTEADAIGSNPRAMLRSGEHPAAFYQQMWETILAGRVWSGEMKNRRKDGTVYAEAQTITPVINAEGEITHFIAIKRDLTKERQLEAQFLHAQKMESVGRLAGGVAHDFNNLLAVILGWTEMTLVDLPTEHKARPALDEVLSASQRAAGLTRQLLTFSRQQVAEPIVFDVNALVEETERMLRRLVGERTEIAIRSAPALGAVKMDRGQLQQVVMNLAINARDAMPLGGTLTIETANVTVDAQASRALGDLPAGEYVRLAVSDSGIGMNPQVMKHLFEPFFTTKTVGKGTGLGLATSFGIVSQVGGRIDVQSEEGIGTTMSIYLPRSREDMAAPARARRTTPLRGVETILLVEDEPAVRQVVATMLQGRGYRVLGAGSADEAFALIAAERDAVHLLLSDIVLERGVTGPELAERIRTLRPKVRVLFMSGYGGEITEPKGVSARPIALIQKPFTAEELGRSVRQVLDAN